MKYEISEIRHHKYPHLNRIRALKDFSDVKKGDMGGYVEKEYNLSQDGDCWIYNNAMVFDDARIYGNAKIHDNVVVKENARIYDNAQVINNAIIKGDALVYFKSIIRGSPIIYGKAEICGDDKFPLVSGEQRVNS